MNVHPRYMYKFIARMSAISVFQIHKANSAFCEARGALILYIFVDETDLFLFLLI